MQEPVNQLVIQKRRKTSPNSQLTELPQLAPELWEQIFLRVPPGHLLKLRQTCRYWRNIVDGSPALRDRLHVKFPHDGDQHYAPFLIPPVGWFRFEFASFSVLPYVGWWWPKVGESVTVLCLGRCEFPLELLRHTPNLKELLLFYVKLVEFDNPDFKLRKVKALKVEYVDPDILKVLGQVISNLKLFCFNGSVMDASEEADEKREGLKLVANQLDEMDKKYLDMEKRYGAEFLKSESLIPYLTETWRRHITCPKLFGEAILFEGPRVVRNARIDPTHEELEMIRGLRDISEEELTAFILRYPGLRALLLLNCEVVCNAVLEKMCPILNKMLKYADPNCQPTSDSDVNKLTYWRYPGTFGRW
uniref:(northern house mosquito) hypothetical protein n=1 Tax=Culex pipiens TaxID=7175 RepID=A0A8D8CGK4_CULPI